MNNEALIRVGFFTAVFAIVSVLEVLAPRRIRTASKSRRWVSNLTLVALNPLSVRLVFPILPVGVALIASERSWGLLNNINLPSLLEVAIGVLSLDLTVYLQHVLHHAIPLLRRFHPIEITVPMTLKLAAIGDPGKVQINRR